MRRVLFSAALTVWFAVPCVAQTITKVSLATKNASQTGGSLVSAAQTHTAANLLVATLYHQDNTATATGCTNTGGDTWAPTRATAFTASIGGTNRVVEIWYTATASTAASTPTGTIGVASDIVTCTINSANTYTAMDVYEFNKTSGTWGLVGDSTGSAASGATSFTTGTLTLSNPSVIVGDLLVSVQQTVTGGTGYTANGTDTNNSNGFVWSEYHITSTSEAATASGTSTGYAFIAAAFQASGGGGGGTTVTQNIFTLTGIMAAVLSIGSAWMVRTSMHRRAPVVVVMQDQVLTPQERERLLGVRPLGPARVTETRQRERHADLQ